MGDCTIVAVFAVAVAACRASDPVAACVEASKQHAANDIELCQSAFSDAHVPLAGASLARALAFRHQPVGDIEALARDIGDQPGGAEAWNAVGVAYEADSTRALVAYQRALDHRDPSEFRDRARDAVGLYHHYVLTNQFRLALHVAGMAYDLSNRSGDRDLRGYVLAGLASFLYEIGDLPAVESLVHEADDAIDATSPFAPHIHGMRGVVHRARNRHQLARREFAKAIDGARTAGLDPVLHAYSYEYATMELDDGRVDEAERVLLADRTFDPADAENRLQHDIGLARVAVAREHYDKSLALTAGAYDGAPADVVADLQALRGQALARLGRIDEARAALEDAAKRYEARRADLGFDVLKPWMSRHDRPPLEDLFTIAVTEHNDEEALAIAQRATARSILDGLLARQAPEARTLDGDLVRAAERVEGLLKLTHALRSSEAIQPPPVGTLLASLRDMHVLTYFRARTKLWLIDLPAGGRPHTLLIGDVAELTGQIEASTSSQRIDLADPLGRALLPESVALVPGEILHIVVDDPIREVAFAALRRDGQFLIERNPVVYEPSAAVLGVLTSRPLHDGTALVLGNATGDLHAAEIEANEVAAKLSIDAKLGKKATRSAVLDAGNTSLLHVATHTISTPLGPALALADGTVGAGDVLDRGIGANLVVLASCVSADAHNRSELGPLASAFLAAGARTVVATRSYVDDKLALVFARAFYAAGGAHAPAYAAAIAQRQLINAKVETAAWSTFVVLGMPTGGGTP